MNEVWSCCLLLLLIIRSVYLTYAANSLFYNLKFSFMERSDPTVEGCFWGPTTIHGMARGDSEGELEWSGNDFIIRPVLGLPFLK
jgi:hypothetical protein